MPVGINIIKLLVNLICDSTILFLLGLRFESENKFDMQFEELNLWYTNSHRVISALKIQARPFSFCFLIVAGYFILFKIISCSKLTILSYFFIWFVIITIPASVYDCVFKSNSNWCIIFIELENVFKIYIEILRHQDSASYLTFFCLLMLFT